MEKRKRKIKIAGWVIGSVLLVLYFICPHVFGFSFSEKDDVFFRLVIFNLGAFYLLWEKYGGRILLLLAILSFCLIALLYSVDVSLGTITFLYCFLWVIDLTILFSLKKDERKERLLRGALPTGKTGLEMEEDKSGGTQAEADQADSDPSVNRD